jgi:fido (protein-threonine AMPylation protein)
MHPPSWTTTHSRLPRRFSTVGERPALAGGGGHLRNSLAVDLKLVREIHFRWFETTFPADAGHFRTQMVLNRKSTAAEVEAILPAIQDGCENWNWRRERYRPTDDLDLIEFIVAEANTLAVRVYDVHPFLDGNTRATWHLLTMNLSRLF